MKWLSFQEQERERLVREREQRQEWWRIYNEETRKLWDVEGMDARTLTIQYDKKQ